MMREERASHDSWQSGAKDYSRKQILGSIGCDMTLILLQDPVKRSKSIYLPGQAGLTSP